MEKGDNETQMETDLTPEVNFGLAAQDYARWRQGFPDSLFARLEDFRIGNKGQKILDIGTGTGLLGRGFAKRGCLVTGLDASAELIEQARILDKSEGLSTEYHLARAENSGLENASYDVVAAATCWHWFDRPKVAKECLRLLKHDGRLLIAHLDWLNLPGNAIDITLKTIRQFKTSGATKPITFQYPDWLTELIDAGFDSYEIFGCSTIQDYTQEAWRGRIRASRLVRPEMDAETLKNFDEALEQTLAKNFPDFMLKVDQRIFVIVLWRR